MPSTTRETDPGPDDSVTKPTGPGEGPMSPGWILTVAIYLVLASILVLYGLVKLWPYPTPSGEPKDAQAAASQVPTGTNGSGVGPTQTTPGTNTTVLTAAPNAAGRAGTATAPNPAGASSQTAGTAGAPAGTATSAAGTGASATGISTQPALPVSPTPAPTPVQRKLPDPEVISFFGGRFKPTIYLETRLLLLVMLAGALGSLMHSLRSLYWYTGNRMMVWSWVGFYVLLPFTGAILAVIFYFVMRGGFFSPQAEFQDTSPFGFAALSALVGLFSPQATLKLKEIAETIFTKPPAGEDTKSQETGSDATTETETATTTEAAADTEAAAGTEADELDVHDLDLKPDTADEDLPITEGGVA